MLDETQRPEGLCEDPKELRRWLRDMENQLENSPTISELTLYSISELQRHLAVHSVSRQASLLHFYYTAYFAAQLKSVFGGKGILILRIMVRSCYKTISTTDSKFM